MKLVEWAKSTRSNNEILDVFLQIVRLRLKNSSDSTKTANLLTAPANGLCAVGVSPASYEVDADNFNEVAYIRLADSDPELAELAEKFAAPDTLEDCSDKKAAEKRDVFSLGLMLHFLFHGEIFDCENKKQNLFAFAKMKKSVEGSAIKAPDVEPHSQLIERMTAYDPNLRPDLNEIVRTLTSGVCRFGVIRENILTGERYKEIVRCFSENNEQHGYKFYADDEYLIDGAVIKPLFPEPLVVPFRLIKKDYIMSVAYGNDERWHCIKKAELKPGSPDIEGLRLATEEETFDCPKAVAALKFCDTVYGIGGHCLFCDVEPIHRLEEKSTDSDENTAAKPPKLQGYFYEMGLYRYTRSDKDNTDKQICIYKSGEIVAPERLEARIRSILKEGEMAVYDLYCVAVYGNLCPNIIKTINDTFPEAIRIYRLSEEDILKGIALYCDTADDIRHYTKEKALSVG